MRLFLTIFLLFWSIPSANASDTEEAASLLSRFPQGAVPASISVLEALGQLAESGDVEHISLLESLIQDESHEVRQAANAALAVISNRERSTLRANFSPPSAQDVDMLARSVENAAAGLGLYERRALAYAVLVLRRIPSNTTNDWRSVTHEREDAKDSRGALQSYAQAAALGSHDALEAIQSYGVDGEQLILGIWTAWCPDRTDTTITLETLVHVGSIQTVRVLANRAVRSRAYHRAIALDALSRMLADGKLTKPAMAIARTGLVSGTNDPHTDVRVLARTALDELKTRSSH